MVSKQLIIYVLLISLLPLMTNSPSQVSTSLTTVESSSTLTSYSTYTIGMTQVTSTVIKTVYSGNLPLPGWGSTGCAGAGFPFYASPGDLLTVNFASNVPVDFYIMSAGQFQAMPPSTSLCSGYGAIPVLPSLKSASYQTSYSLTWTPPFPGTYYVVLMDLQADPAAVMLSAGVTSLQAQSVVLNATTTTTFTSVNSEILSTMVTVQSSTAASEGIQTESLLWIVVVLILVALGVVFILSKKRSAKAG
jgi:hypothetical protein